MPFTGYFPLRWESTGDQWWFASPIDCAAANGHYDLVRELLRIDPNLLIKLTSLPRIRRLESVWDDEENSTNNIAKCRAHVARKLLRECDASKGHDSLIRAGYGGWLLYTAASAGDVIFVKELLDRDPYLVFGEGEYGVTDIFYAASRSKNCEVFRLLLDCSLSLKYQQNEKSDEVFKSEMMNRAVHASARGGNVEMLRELLGDECDVLEYRDAQGSSLLHTASGRGKVEVVKYLIASYDIIAASVDNQGNTALHIAAFRGNLTVLEILLSELSPSAPATNHDGDTFLHMAIAGFHASGFRRIDKQIDLMKRLLSGHLINLEHIVNIKNNDGRTALHMAVIEDVQSDIVELLMSVCYMSLNERDNDGSTTLDLLKRRPRSASSEILIKRLVSLGGVSNHHEETTPSNAVKTRAMECSPGTSFRIPDSEIILCTATDDTCPSSCGDLTVSEHAYSGEIEQASPIAESYSSSKLKRFSSVNKATTYLKILLRKQAKKSTDAMGDDCSVESYKMRNGSAPIPLRQQFAAVSSFPSNKRILSLQGRCSSPSLSMKKKVTNHRVNHPYAMLKSNLGSPSSSAFSESYCSSPVLVDDDDDERRMGENLGARDGDVPCSISYHSSPHNEKHDKMKLKQKHASFNMRLMNKYLCFGAQGLAVEDSITSRRHTQIEIDQALVV